MDKNKQYENEEVVQPMNEQEARKIATELWTAIEDSASYSFNLKRTTFIINSIG